MFKWKKLGKIFNPAELPGDNWMKEYAQSPSAVIYPDYVRVYFASRPAPDQSGQYKSYLSYVDLNKKNLFDIINVAPQPILPLGELGTFDEFGMNPASAILHGQETRIYYAGWTRCESVPFNASIGCAISPAHQKPFKRIGMGPVLTHTLDEPFVIGSPRIRLFNNRWYLWYAAGKTWVKDTNRPEPHYTIRMATSEDGIQWKKHGKDLISSKLDENECQASAEVIYLNGLYHMFFSYRYQTAFKNKEKGYRIGYAYSPDLLEWTRDDRQAGIDISEEGWDAEMVSYPNIFTLDDKTYMLYQGNEFGRYGFGIAELVSAPTRE